MQTLKIDLQVLRCSDDKVTKEGFEVAVGTEKYRAYIGCLELDFSQIEIEKKHFIFCTSATCLCRQAHCDHFIIMSVSHEFCVYLLQQVTCTYFSCFLNILLHGLMGRLKGHSLK